MSKRSFCLFIRRTICTNLHCSIYALVIANLSPPPLSWVLVLGLVLMDRKLREPPTLLPSYPRILPPSYSPPLLPSNPPTLLLPSYPPTLLPSYPPGVATRGRSLGVDDARGLGLGRWLEVRRWPGLGVVVEAGVRVSLVRRRAGVVLRTGTTRWFRG